MPTGRPLHLDAPHLPRKPTGLPKVTRSAAVESFLAVDTDPKDPLPRATHAGA